MVKVVLFVWKTLSCARTLECDLRNVKCGKWNASEQRFRPHMFGVFILGILGKTLHAMNRIMAKMFPVFTDLACFWMRFREWMLNSCVVDFWAEFNNLIFYTQGLTQDGNAFGCFVKSSIFSTPRWWETWVHKVFQFRSKYYYAFCSSGSVESGVRNIKARSWVRFPTNARVD